MLDIYAYMSNTKELRQKHLQLNTSCIIRTVSKKGVSAWCKALLADRLDTSIPEGKQIHLAHACNNGQCCNPLHLYWATSKENYHDTPRTTIWERMVAKHGLEQATEIQRKGNKSAGGAARKGKTLSASHREKISRSLKKAHVGELVDPQD